MILSDVPRRLPQAHSPVAPRAYCRRVMVLHNNLSNVAC